MHHFGCIALALTAAALAIPCAAICSSVGFTGVAALAGGLFVMSMVS